MRRVLLACLSSAALFLGSVAFLAGGAGLANAAPAAGISLAGSWEVQIPSLCGTACETIRFDTAAKTFAEHDTHPYKDHGAYSLAQHVLKLLWTSGASRGLSFTGTYNSTKNEFVGTYMGATSSYSGDLVHLP